jgi:hypothetical protein
MSSKPAVGAAPKKRSTPPRTTALKQSEASTGPRLDQVFRQEAQKAEADGGCPRGCRKTTGRLGERKMMAIMRQIEEMDDK